jgi:hypothetical protein
MVALRPVSGSRTVQACYIFPIPSQSPCHEAVRHVVAFRGYPGLGGRRKAEPLWPPPTEGYLQGLTSRFRAVPYPVTGSGGVSNGATRCAQDIGPLRPRSNAHLLPGRHARWPLVTLATVSSQGLLATRPVATGYKQRDQVTFNLTVGGRGRSADYHFSRSAKPTLQGEGRCQSVRPSGGSLPSS